MSSWGDTSTPATVQSSTPVKPRPSPPPPDTVFSLKLKPANTPVGDTSQGMVHVFPRGISAGEMSVAIHDANGCKLPSRIIRRASGEPVKVIFKTNRSREYTAYAFRGSSIPPDNGFQPGAGLLLETRPLKPGQLDTLSQFRAMWEAAPYSFGIGAVSNVFHGHNPFGPHIDFMSRYTGFFRTPEGGTHHFATVSDDASFLLVNDKLVAQWPGFHGAGAGIRGEHSGTIDLSPGIHRIEYLHAQGQGPSTALAAWRKPGMQHFKIMPPGAFVSLTRFEPVSCAPDTAYFEWEPDSHTMDKNSALVFMSLSAIAPGDATCEWKFDDGEAAAGHNTKHLFVSTGIHTVTLNVARSGKSDTLCRAEVKVTPNRDQRHDWPPNVFERQKRILLKRTCATIPPDGIRALIEWTILCDDPDLYKRIADECSTHWYTLNKTHAAPLLQLAILLAAPENRQYETAARAMKTARKLCSIDSGAYQEAGYRLADLTLKHLDEQEQAEKILDETWNRLLDSESRRGKGLLDAELSILNGNIEQARKIIARLEKQNQDKNTVLKKLSRMESARDLLRRKNYVDTLIAMESLEHDFPDLELRLETHMIFLDAFMGLKEYPSALARGRLAMALDKTPGESAELLSRLYEINRGLGRNEKAAGYRARLLEEYPYSKQAAELFEVDPLSKSE